MKNKITFLLLHLGYGGIETATINTANALSDKYEVELVSLYKLKINQENLINKNVKIIHLYNGEPNKKEFLDCIKKFKIINLFKESLKAIKIIYLKKKLIKKYIQSCNSKVIISTRWDFSVLLSKYKRENAIAVAQEHHYHNNNNKYINILSNHYNNIDYLLALTDALKKDYEKFLCKNNYTKILVMPNMIVLPNKVISLKTKNVVSVGRLHEAKKIDDLIEIVSKSKNVDKFYIVGDGVEYKKLDKMINQFNLADKIILTGYKNKFEIEEIYNNCSIFLMASLTEGLPMVLLEAMSYGIPCIVFENGCSLSEIVEDNKNGYVILNRDKDKFSEKIDSLLDNEKLLKKFSDASIKKAQCFSTKNIVKKWYGLIDTSFKKNC